MKIAQLFESIGTTSNLNPPASKAAVMAAYSKFPEEFRKKFPLTEKGVIGGRGVSMQYLQVLLANVGKPFKDGSQEVKDLLIGLGVNTRDPQFRHLKWRASGNGFPLHAKWGKPDGLPMSHYMLVAFEPDGIYSPQPFHT
jgi:hypothetical protein